MVVWNGHEFDTIKVILRTNLVDHLLDGVVVAGTLRDHSLGFMTIEFNSEMERTARAQTSCCAAFLSSSSSSCKSRVCIKCINGNSVRDGMPCWCSASERMMLGGTRRLMSATMRRSTRAFLYGTAVEAASAIVRPPA